MDQKGFLIFLADETDKRSKLIDLSDKGKTFIEPIIVQLTETELRVSEQFSLPQFDKLLNDTETLLGLFKAQLTL